MTITVSAGTTLHCNRCNKAFTLSQDIERGPFGGSRAARLTTFSRCPHCDMRDAHWLFASDIVLPIFEGNFDERKRAERQWLDLN